jgi:hypothetical protein
LLLFSSCKDAKLHINDNNILKVEFASGECYNKCAQLAIGIDSTLTFNYYGGRNVKLNGFYSGNISKATWDTLNRKLDAIHYKGPIDGEGPIDDQEVELIIHYHNKSIHINTTSSNLPDSTRKVIEWLKSLRDSIKLIAVKDSIKFGTILQYEKPPIPNIKQIKFPPPIKAKKYRRP